MGSLSDPPHEDPPWEAAQVPWPQEQQPAKTCCPEKPTEKPLQNFSPEEKVPSHKRDKISLGHKQAGSPDTLSFSPCPSETSLNPLQRKSKH